MNAPTRHRESHCVEESPRRFLTRTAVSVFTVLNLLRNLSGPSLDDKQSPNSTRTSIATRAPRAHDARSHTVQYRAAQRGKNWASTKSMKLRQRRQLIQDVGHAASCLSIVIYDTRRGGPVRAHVDHIWWQRLLARRSVGQTCGQRLLARRSARGGLRSRAGCGHGSGS